ncbi:MAG: DUF5670 family protein [Desulfomonilaceae bacterium]
MPHWLGGFIHVLLVIAVVVVE